VPPFSIKVTELVEVVPDEITSDLIFPSGSVLCTAFDILPTRKFQVLLALGTLLANVVVASEFPVAADVPFTTIRQTPPGPTWREYIANALATTALLDVPHVYVPVAPDLLR
jgi:hypothetical protein